MPLSVDQTSSGMTFIPRIIKVRHSVENLLEEEEGKHGDKMIE
jgi:hypothetical protein